MIISSIRAVIEAITGLNESVTFLQWLRSLQSRSNGAENQELREDDVLKLQTSLQCLEATLPVMCDLIDRAEWKIHEKCVEELLPELKAAVYDAEDIVDVLRDYERKVKNEGSATSMELFHDVIQGNFKKLNHIKERLDNLSRLLEKFGIDQDTRPRFDRSARPETTRFPIEAKIFGRDDEIKKLISLLGVPGSNTRGPPRPKRKRSTTVPVLPMVGIGGVGKTTLAQTICSNPKVQKHFDVIVWICVSDDFDVKRLTKEAIEKISGNTPTMDNLSSLQEYLIHSINGTRFLFVLDDVWVEDAELWKRFYAPFKDVLEGSMMLVTTRSQKVADIVRTTDPFLLEGLNDSILQNFFKRCVFGSDSSNNNPELERIGEQILPKLKGSPLAAKTLGRLLGMSFDPAHWNMILNSELWEHRQEGTDIMPALRLSYMYLPFHLKRCFSFCAVYPKDYNFVKEDLAEIWMAEGFVVAQGNIPLQQTACNYFEELAHLSFFQKLRGKYVIHDLIHDMAQLVSSDECFIIKEKKDLERIPQRVRHLSVLKSRDIEWSDLENLCKQTKLRTLLCNMSLKCKKGNNVMDKWCAELLCMRVMVCASISKSGLPDSISNMKNLRYLKISDDCKFDSLPAALCHLYNLQLLSAKKCRINVLPEGFSNLVNLQKFELHVDKIDAEKVKLNWNLFTGDCIYLCNLYEISKDHAAKIELMKKGTFNLTLDWSKEINLSLVPQVQNGIEVFKALHPPTTIKFVCLRCYPGEYLPSWSHGSDVPTIFTSLTEITIIDCSRLSSLEQFLQPAYMPAIKKMLIKFCTSLVSVPVERFGGSPSLEELEVRNCPKINSQHLLAPSLKKLTLQNSGNLGDDIDCSSLTTFHLSAYHLASLTFNGEKLPRLTDLTIVGCPELDTLNGATIFSSLTEITIIDCQKLSSLEQFLQPAYMPAIKKMLIKLCTSLVSVPVERFGGLPNLEELEVCNCPMINSQHLLAPSLKKLTLRNSGNLGDDIDCSSLTTFHLSDYRLASLTFNGEKLPRLTDLTVNDCPKLDTLNGGWHILKSLSIERCPCLKWENGIVLPSSLQKLVLWNCGSFSMRCLENLTSLETLQMIGCKHIEYIQRRLLYSVQNLAFYDCENLVSIGGPEAIAQIPKVIIELCPKLKEVQQPLDRGKDCPSPSR